MVASEVLFRILLVVFKKRDVRLERVLQHELSAVFPTLFNDDGTIRKTTKSDLTKKLDVCDKVYELPAYISRAFVIDRCQFLQYVKEERFTTFNG